METWANFFVAMVGAAATLTGLIFVGVSLSLTKLLAIPRMADRAWGALLLLVNVLIVSGFCLVPKQSYPILGIEILVISSLLWFLSLRLDLSILRLTEKKYKKQYQLIVLLTQFAIVPYIIGGFTLLFSGVNGLYWLIPAIMLSFCKAILDAWVILVEIHR